MSPRKQGPGSSLSCQGAARKTEPWGTSDKGNPPQLQYFPSRNLGLPLAHSLPIGLSRNISKISTWFSSEDPKYFPQKWPPEEKAVDPRTHPASGPREGGQGRGQNLPQRTLVWKSHPRATEALGVAFFFLISVLFIMGNFKLIRK